MNKRLIAAALVVASSAVAATPERTLELLGAQLRSTRALPSGSHAQIRCPDELNNLRGVAMAEIKSALGTPDFESGVRSSYFFTAPLPSAQRGGGFPVLTFVNASTGRVSHASCVYAK
jgi:hypothetical protein